MYVMLVIVLDAYGDHSLIYLLPNMWKNNNLVVSTWCECINNI